MIVYQVETFPETTTELHHTMLAIVLTIKPRIDGSTNTTVEQMKKKQQTRWKDRKARSVFYRHKVSMFITYTANYRGLGRF